MFDQGFTKLADGSRTWGVVDFDITGDTQQAIVCGLNMAFVEKSSFTHYKVVHGERGCTELLFLSGATTDRGLAGIIDLPFPLKTVEAAKSFILSWLEAHGKPDPEDDFGGDGSSNYGVRMTNSSEGLDYNSSNYLALRVKPTYVYYSK